MFNVAYYIVSALENVGDDIISDIKGGFKWILTSLIISLSIISLLIITLIFASDNKTRMSDVDNEQRTKEQPIGEIH
jgi:hypothetical protein